jgi:hypothetical protein
MKKKEIVQNTIVDTHLGIAITVDINTVDDLFHSYTHLLETEGFNCTVNVAPVDGKYWPVKKQKTFITQLEEIHMYIFEKI